ncbi:cytochrome d ubiquinol oxidase subunit II [Mycobacteroides abscessus]|uniref:Cytochrome d ubiquinol oxidase, subunit II n=1 Tax=Mycobacteroides abscessus subsp. bolletii 1513 TaxID=1299321 RepID=X8DS87_9MYCO|nr:cytochrome d ubiquinol oxidase subunit II [Mycobacteroides abscessus]EUA70350.1 cytochrome d ubiquinol oxidase, subunit II [Mycobacteroides abscessus subsp. bolletii 1513]AMU70678.1 cytochrome C oxidase assembly protein [Mycobacteroides abscessus]EIU12582.1 cytochrome d ubiquinol oxidase, subunit II [Mycobacteroides abscessus 5S-0304]EIU14226.1 cytochrome d ubiquinol oxidase, subunit II [Mycobacteroides abscessus 5S-0421]EIU15103.1 cytochrome d ubiquinol oxidase, subunit II [Mycobacteroides
MNPTALQQFWFVVVAVLFLGFLVLEGFDFGVGMLMHPLGRGDDRRRRAVLNTIGPVWDGNEVWLITAGGAMFAAFPHWYATVFSGLYLPLLLILVSMIVRIVAIEWRGKIDDPRWRARCDLGIAIGSWIPALLWGVAFSSLLAGLPVDGAKQLTLTVGDVLRPYVLLGGVVFVGLFALHGALFICLKTSGVVRDDAVAWARKLAAPVIVGAGGYGLWTQLAYGASWTWIALGTAALSLVAAALASRISRDGWAFACTCLTVVAVVALLFGSLYPNLIVSSLDPAYNLTIVNASSSPYTLKVMSWAAAITAPVVLVYQGWTYWVFRQRISAEQIPDPVGLTVR